MTDIFEFKNKINIEKNHEGAITWNSPSNIALIKYWGKKEIQIPKNSSLSFTLSKCSTNCNLRFKFSKSIKEFKFQLFFEGKREISFETKNPIENNMIMCGDSAGMIHPLCGNGMGMAIRSAQLASELIIDYLQNKIKSRVELERKYSRGWNRTFSLRLKVGHSIAYLFRQEWLAPKLLFVLRRLPFLVPLIIKMTHGKSMKV